MFVLFFFIYCVFALSKEYQTIQEVIKRLHRDTDFKTLYEVFDIYSFTPVDDIQKKFVKLITAKETPPRFHLPLKDYKNLVTACYDILKKNKDAYEEILNSPWLMFDNSNNYKNSRLMIFASILALLLCVDFVYYCYRFAKYCNLTTTEIDAEPTKKKKKAKKSFIQSSMSKPEMYIYLGYRRLLAIFGH